MAEDLSDEYAEVVEKAQRDALLLYDLLLREIFSHDFKVVSDDPAANARVEEILTHMREGTCPESQGDRLRRLMAEKQK